MSLQRLLCRNHLNWRNVGKHKVDAISYELELINPGVDIKKSKINITEQESSSVLNNILNRLGKCDIIITGFKTIDGSTAQVSYQLSELFKIPHITQIHKIEIKDKTAIVERLFGHEYQTIKVDLPIILAVNSDTNKVRHVKLFDIKNCFAACSELFTQYELVVIVNEACLYF